MFKPGDVVVLRGNVHPLTVKTVSGEKIAVVWFDSFWKLYQEQFTADLLEYRDGAKTASVPLTMEQHNEGKPRKQS